MILRLISSPLDLRPPPYSFVPLPDGRRNPRSRHSLPFLRKWRHRRRPRPLARASLDDLFTDLLSAFLSPNAFPLLAPALGFFSGAAVLLSSRQGNPTASIVSADAESVVGDWILYTSPTPFNRSVLLRCPSVSFKDGGELLGSVNERLMREERHYVNMCQGRISLARKEGQMGVEDEGSYQRVCVGAEDGGVISLDWPDNLDLRREHGLEATVLIVPGTAEGSMERNIRIFVLDALKHGYFPIVMNPRGCAGSPLTTARLFTAADSDDIRSAIQFINSRRPWTTLMSVGWGYGANMLTKYLAEVGESTPLTAAVCIDNPFDLEEATRSSPHRIALDQKLVTGLIEILRANKELFQGKAKDFDIQKALSATSIRVFDEAISMISFGCDVVEDFYAKTSTRQSVGSVKIPVLFIQSDDGTVPIFSVPRCLIAENPFTSLLCSCLPSAIVRTERCAVLWCQHLAIEWLSAVELALLKGRHPLLKDIDVTINPSKGLADSYGLSGRRMSDRNKVYGSYDSSQLLLRNRNLVNGLLVDPLVKDAVADNNQTDKVTGSAEVNGHVAQTEDNPSEIEGSQVLQTASVVMNMLDVTIPRILNDEQKKKVLTAMEQGESLVKALQGAVPEDVRSKLTNSVNEILRSQRANLSFDGLSGNGGNDKTSEDKTRFQGNSKGLSTNENAHKDTDTGGYRDGNPVDQNRGVAGSNEHARNDANLVPENVSVQESFGSSQGKASQNSGYGESGLEKSSEQAIPNDNEKASCVVSEGGLQHNVEQGHGTADKYSLDVQSRVNDSNDAPKDDVSLDPTDDPNILDQNLQNSSKLEEPSLQQPSSKPPSINVTQAIDALTGFDDSTQMAVNSVFGVLENMIDQLEKKNDMENDNDLDKSKDQETGDETSDTPNVVTVFAKPEEEKDTLIAELSITQESIQPENLNRRDPPSPNKGGNNMDDDITYGSMSSVRKKIGSQENYSGHSSVKGNYYGSVQNFSLDRAMNPYWNTQYVTYLCRYLSTQLPMKWPDLNSTTDLFLDPEEGKWKMVDLERRVENDTDEVDRYGSYPEEVHTSSSQSAETDKVFDPSYIILKNNLSNSAQKSDGKCKQIGQSKPHDAKLRSVLKDKLLAALKIEVFRKLGISNMEEVETDLVSDMEQLAIVVSQKVVSSSQLHLVPIPEKSDQTAKLGVVEGGYLITMISSSMHEAIHLRKVLPVGLIVGAMLASLRKYFEVVQHCGHHSKAINAYGEVDEGHFGQACDADLNWLSSQENFTENGSSVRKKDLDEIGKPMSEDKALETSRSYNGSIMVGAVTTALGASALLAHHQQKKIQELDKHTDDPSLSPNQKGFLQEEHAKLDETIEERSHTSLISSLAEKAMSVAGPVVPTKSDGEVDQERLVAVLAELGQKGGFLRLIGRIALLWGGIRGAMSLTDRLISFLRISERPLFQRVLVFACMILVLWSPVLIPLMPTLVQSWTTSASTGIVGYACIAGLYVSIMILIILWGKRIRGYDNPLEQYGLDLTSLPRLQDFLKGCIGGISVVLLTHTTNCLFGYASLSWPPSLPISSAGALVLLRTYGTILGLVVRGIVTAASIAVVEELLFRSWLPEEIAVDLGYYQSILISGIAFSLIYRSVSSIPGFLMLSLVLFGIKQRTQGKLAAPIGMHTGIMAASYILQAGGFIKYRPGTPFWLTSTHHLHPFDGAVGLTVCSLLGILLFPHKSLQKNT